MVTSTPRQHPIIFLPPMVQALLEGRKTSIRRVVTSPKPYAEKGDLLWIKERWSPAHAPHREWNTPLFMPKAAARLWLKVTGVTRQKLWDITEKEAQDEGVEPVNGSYIAGYKKLWETLRGDTHQHAWKANPDVWAIRFRHTAPPAGPMRDKFPKMPAQPRTGLAKATIHAVRPH